MSTSTRIPLARATAIARALVEEMQPHCERIMIAGSIRRGSETIGDIEICALPRWAKDTDLFGAPYPVENTLYAWAVAQEKDGKIAWTKGFDPRGRYWQGVLPTGLKLDLFLPIPEGWAAITLIRTGSAEFTERVMGFAKYRGYRFDAGVLKTIDGEVVLVEDEREVFDLLGLEYTPPCERTGAHAVVRKRGQWQQSTKLGVEMGGQGR